MPYIGFTNDSQLAGIVLASPDINGSKLTLDADADTSITADSDDQIDIEIAGSDEIKITAAMIAPSTADGSALGGTSNEWSDLYLADGAVIGLGADQDVTLTHVADTGLLLNSTMALQFNDASQYINAPSATVLDINATDEVEVNATLMDINANVEISGTATTTGVHTFTAVPVFPNNTVETADIQADAITGAKIADDAIDSEHYTDGSIDNAHIADDAIDSEHYAAGSIDTAHIADDQITLAKMAGGTDGNVISYDASGDPVAIATGNDGQVLTSTGAGSPPAFEDASGGAWTLIGTSDASDSATLDQTGLSSTYDHYAIGISAIKVASDGNPIYMRMGDSSGFDSGASDYDSSYTNALTPEGTWSKINNAGTSSLIMSNNQGNATGEGWSAMLFLNTPGDADIKPGITGSVNFVDSSGGRVGGGPISGFRNAVIALDRIQIFVSTGNITTGRMTVWGIKHT